MNFWNAIVESNTFNFAVLMLIFVLLYKKLNLSESINSLKQNIIQKIDDAKLERRKAKENLAEIQKSVENLDGEIKVRLNDAVERGNILSKQIENETLTQVQNIKRNIENIIFAEEKTISAKLQEKSLNNAIELAKEKIVNTLEQNPELHNKFIEESIGKI